MFLGAVAVRVNDKPLPVCDEAAHYRVPEDKVLWVTIDPNSLDIDGDIWPIELQTKTQIVARRASGTVDQEVTIRLARPRRADIVTRVSDDRGLVCAIDQVFKAK